LEDEAHLTQRHVGVDSLALDVMRIRHHGGLSDGLMGNKSALDFGGTEPVAADIHHVVNAAWANKKKKKKKG
jgi:hypothetical protein